MLWIVSTSTVAFAKWLIIFCVADDEFILLHVSIGSWIVILESSPNWICFIRVARCHCSFDFFSACLTVVKLSNLHFERNHLLSNIFSRSPLVDIVLALKSAHLRRGVKKATTTKYTSLLPIIWFRFTFVWFRSSLHNQCLPSIQKLVTERLIRRNIKMRKCFSEWNRFCDMKMARCMVFVIVNDSKWTNFVATIYQCFPLDIMYSINWFNAKHFTDLLYKNAFAYTDRSA